MSDILSAEEIEALLSELEESDSVLYSNMSTIDFAISIIQGGHRRITEHISREGRIPGSSDVIEYYYESTKELLIWLKERKDKDEILALVNENSSLYKCKVHLYLSPVDGELKKY